MVLDASVVLEVLLRTPVGIRFQSGWKEPLEFHAPHLLDLEVAQVLRRYVLNQGMDAGRAEEALEDFSLLPIIRYPHDRFLRRIWELRRNATSYDAAYLVLAEALEVPFMTCDKRLAAIPGLRAAVKVLE